MQLEYTLIDPSNVRTSEGGVLEGGPVVALSYSFNGSPFHRLLREYDSSIKQNVGIGGYYDFDLQPSHGAEVFLNVTSASRGP